MRRAIGILVLAFAVLPACETAHDRLMAEKYPTYPANVRHAIDRGYVMYGMTQEQVLLSRGEPVCKRTLTHDGRQVDVWLFPPGGANPCEAAEFRVYFENGRVSGWRSQEDQPIRHRPRAEE